MDLMQFNGKIITVKQGVKHTDPLYGTLQKHLDLHPDAVLVIQGYIPEKMNPLGSYDVMDVVNGKRFPSLPANWFNREPVRF